MKSIISISLLLFAFCVHPSLQFNCKNKCNRCCSSGSSEYRRVPLYEMILTKSESRFYTASVREMSEFIKKGYIRKSIIGLVAVSKTDCKKQKSLVPVQRFCNEETSDYLYQFKADEHAENRTKYTLEGTVFHGAGTEKQCGATLALYRFWNGKTHFYGTDIEECKRRCGSKCVDEGIICYIWPVPNTDETTTTSTTTTTTTTTTRDPLENPGNCSMNLTKLFRLYRPSTDSHLFTTSYTEAINAYQNLQYNPEKSPGYVAPEMPSCRCNLIPVYRTYRLAPNEDHFYTTSKTESDNAVAKLDYSDEGIAYYCAEKLGDCGASTAFYRSVRNNKQSSHFYTADLKESAANGTSEGILCYIWLQ